MEIVLIRHGKPASASNPRVNATEYTQWIRRYNASEVSPHSHPSTMNDYYKSYYIASSDLKRAIHSAHIYVEKQPNTIDKLFREMEIPRYKLPITLKAFHWIFVTRILWMLGCKGPFESFKQAKFRANKAATSLIDMAEKHDKVVLFAHGYINVFIRKALIKQGWIVQAKDNTYWGVNILCRAQNHR